VKSHKTWRHKDHKENCGVCASISGVNLVTKVFTVWRKSPDLVGPFGIVRARRDGRLEEQYANDSAF